MRRSSSTCLPASAVLAAACVVPAPPAHAQVTALPCPLTAPYRADNAFARIIRGELPGSIIAQDERAIALVPLAWDHPGHALVIPKARVRNLYDLGDRDALALLRMVKRVATAQRRAFGSTGFSLQQNNARAQEVCQLHVHVIPNSPSAPRKPATRAEMDEVAARLKAALPPR